MTLLIVLIGLALESYANVNDYLKRFNWFDMYLEQLRQKLGHTPLWAGSWQVLLTTIVPIIIGIVLLYVILGFWIPGLARLVIGTFVFVYCLGPGDLFQRLKTYRASLENSNMVDDSSTGVSVPTSEFTQSLCEVIFEQANEQVLGVIFWFGILGPIGAIFYRMMALLLQTSRRPDSLYQAYEDNFARVYGVINWLPARVAALGYALVGNFSDTLSQWLDLVFTSWKENSLILRDCGRVTLRISKDDEEKPEAIKAAISLIDRTTILYIVVIALFSLGSWLSF